MKRKVLKVKKLLLICLLAIVMMVILIPVAFASDGEPSVGPDWTQIIIAFVGLLFSVVIIPLVKTAFVWLKSKTENEALLTAITEAQSVADNVVASLQQNIVDGLKQESTDGKLSAGEAKDIMERAIDMFCSDISDGALRVIENNTESAAEYIRRLLESRLVKLKTAKTLKV